MDRKNKVWLIVLIILLILAVAGMVISRNQLADKQAAYDAVNAQLTAAQEASAALESDLTAAQEASAALENDLAAAQEASAALESEVAQLTDSLAAEQGKVAELESAGAASEGSFTELEAKIADLEEALAVAEAQVAELIATQNAEPTEAPAESTETPAEVTETPTEPTEAPAEPTEAPAEPTEAPAEPTEAPAEQVEAIMNSDVSDEEKLAEMQALESELAQTISDLEAQREAVTAAESALASKQAELDAANAVIAELEIQISEMTALTESEVAARAKLETQLASAHDEAAAIAAELDAARAEYEKHVGELQAYMLSRELIDGDAHVATTSASEITVAADGVTAAFNYTNTSVSGNAVVLTIVSGDKELYRSAPIAPGESVAEVALTEALASGEHEAFAVTTVYSEDGSVQLESRVPVTLKVAE